MKLLTEKAKIINEINIYLKIFKLHKSYLLLISDHEEMGIGSVTLGTPPTFEGLKSSFSSYALFGLDQKLLSGVVVERASYILKAPVLLLLFLKKIKKEEDFAKPIILFINDVLREVVESQNKQMK